MPELSVRTEPLSAEALKAAKAETGVRVIVDTGTELPIGPVEGELMVMTTLPEQPVVSLPIIGRIVGDAEFPAGETLSIGPVAVGEKVTIGTYVKLRTSKAVTAKFLQATPQFLHADVHAPSGLINGQQFLVVEVTCPADAPAGEFAGAVEIETTHPTAKRIRIPVRGTVGGDSLSLEPLVNQLP